MQAITRRRLALCRSMRAISAAQPITQDDMERFAGTPIRTKPPSLCDIYEEVLRQRGLKHEASA